MASPRVRFLIGGVQKCGTTALARMLAQHPHVSLPDTKPGAWPDPGGDMREAWLKEAHVFDAPDFDDAWSPAEVDRRFSLRFSSFGDGRMHGDATPVSIYHPRVVQRIARYNQAMRWIILLRDPVERAISHYFMERERGNERRTLLLAVMAEPRRLRGSLPDFSREAAWRRASYADRGRYCRQLDHLFRHFPPPQVLLLRSADLAADPIGTTHRALRFLGLDDAGIVAPDGRILPGRYVAPPAWSPGRLALRLRLRGEVERLRRTYGPDLAET